MIPPPEDFDVTFGLKPDVKESDADRLVGNTYDDRGRIITAPYDHDWVAPRIAVGSAPYHRADVAYLRAMGVTHVLSCECTDTERQYAETGILYMHCPTEDDGKRKGAEFFFRGVKWACDALCESPSHKLLVHCAAGVNRSAGMAYAILRARGLAASKAREAIKRNRPITRDTYFADADRFIAQEWLR